MRSRLEWMGILAMAVLLAGILWVAMRKQKEGSAASGAEAIRLLAVRPDAGDHLYDTQGNPVGTSFFSGPSLPFWSSNMMRRGFIFEVASNTAGSYFATCQIRPSKARSFSMSAGLVMARTPNHRIQLEGAATLPRKMRRPFLLFWNKMDDVKQVDLTVHYHDTTAQIPRARFQGPFNVGEKHSQLGRLTLERITPERAEPSMAAFRITEPQGANSLPTPVILGSNGNSLPTVSTRSSSDGLTNTVVFAVLLSSHADEISEIRIPQVHTATFSKVRVHYPDLPYRAYPALFDPMAEVLGRTNTEALSRSSLAWTGSADDVLKTLEHLRGPLVGAGFRQLITRYPKQPGSNAWSALPVSDQLRVRETARIWTRVSDPQIRLAGTIMGLNGAWPEFVTPALDLIRGNDAYPRQQAAQGLSDQPQLLDEASRRQLIEWLQEHPFHQDLSPLYDMLAMRQENHIRPTGLDDPESPARGN